MHPLFACGGRHDENNGPNGILDDFYPARALRALGLLLADGAPTVGLGKTFWRVGRVPLTKTDVTRKRKVAH